MSNSLEPREPISLFVLGTRLGQVELNDYLAELDRCIASDKPFAMIIDGSNPQLEVAELPPRNWQLTRAAAIASLHRGVAFVTGPMTQERVRVLYALQPQGVAYGFFANINEAREWARAALDGSARSVSSRRRTEPMMSAVSPVRD